ncbi:thymidylate kinase [Candidatus Methanoplasma termitum]|uniref:Tmk1 protein n=1 Tax=Candidatus Methanoplasma termitum TaxID=1577791 RepID=A0A0A7LAU0_9ARCH|nr:hypothetical protein [Candidatus Methanoplasma termitum]AIZ56189.1 thymidylate kinase [Candidatus Methanoplasma termitum]MCL2334155.1 hypothetical protein [Candidatus Methanoplasma sp.]
MQALIPDSLLNDLNQMQQRMLEKGLPVLVVFEGSSGRVNGRVNSELIRCLEPRGVLYRHFDPTTIGSPAEILDFVQHTPAKGQLGLFDRSWYSAAIERYGDGDDWKGLDNMLKVSNDLERYLTLNGILLIKIILKSNVSILKEYGSQYGPKMPRRSFLSLDNIDPQKFKGSVLDHVYERTDTEYAPWNLIKIGDIGKTVIETAEVIIKTVNKRLDSEPPPLAMPEIERTFENPRNCLDLNKRYNMPYDEMINDLSDEIGELQMELSLSDRSLVVCFEGWDAAGKGSCIKHLCHALNPRGYDVYQTKAPTEEELKHTYLWRFLKGIPEKGHITVYDRTWYGRMMVEHIEGLCTEEEYRRSPFEINAFEKMMKDSGIILLKFWLDITPEEQLSRFEKRADDPLKAWKITDEDWRNRSKWDAYNEHVNIMIESTNTKHAPWTVVGSNDKKYARVMVLKSVADAMKKELS